MKTLIFFLFLSSYCHCQTAVVDSLEASLLISKDDTNKVHVLNELAWQYKYLPELGFKYAERAKKLSLKLNFSSGHRTSLSRLGLIHLNEKEYQSAEKIYLELLELEKKARSNYGKARAASFLGETYGGQKKYKKSLEYHLRAHNGFVQQKNDALIATTANNISMVYRNLGEYHNALAYLHKSMEIRRKKKDVKGIAKCHSNLGKVYFNMENYDQALVEFFNSEKILLTTSNHTEVDLLNIYLNIGAAYARLDQLNEALPYYEKSLQIRKNIGQDNDPGIYSNIASVYYEQNKMDKALEFYMKGLSIVEQSNGQIKNTIVYENLGNVYYEKHDLKKAIFYYKKALDMAESSGEKDTQLNVLDRLSVCYGERKDYKQKAFYDNKYIKLSKEYQEDYRNAVQLDAKIREQENREKILLQKQKLSDAKLKESGAKNKLQNQTIYAMVIGIFLMLILAFTFYRNRQHKQKTIIAEKNVRIEQQKLEQSIIDMEVKSLNAMIEGQEKERQRIAADLHDRLGSMLSMVKLHFQSMDDNINQLGTINKSQYEKANNLLDNACVEVRKIAHNMITGVLDKFGLIAALEDLSDSLNQSSKMKVEFISFGMDERLNREVEISIYRIIQELVTNTIKHAKPTELTIQLLKSKSNLNLTVEDNGVGFNAEKFRSQGLGLKSINSRVDHMDGQLIIDSSEGNGTTVTIDIPHFTNQQNA